MLGRYFRASMTSPSYAWIVSVDVVSCTLFMTRSGVLNTIEYTQADLALRMFPQRGEELVASRLLRLPIVLFFFSLFRFLLRPSRPTLLQN